ncbi:type II toxin-antitoxin system RelE/ParE family toxin [Companilactobacillus kedongensis]|uniref:type II toxin-antitoxin system RelE/ParE family toxin n=1 Tax=Companilactobacillus kedongensis TaxID=2486004 RepID=UPI000F779457|nr:type II toxin-antitoxin system RelE/ParE family toxin [Companilactobacillus kedongensis]
MQNPIFEFYTRKNGQSEIKDFILRLPLRDKAKLLGIIKKTEVFGISKAISLGYIKKIGSNEFEIRSQLGNNIQRCLYFHVYAQKYIITNGFTKKSQKTPQYEISKMKKLRKELYNDRK